ncbi:MAG: tripartite tricarboxylate transporter substrate binding protein [Ideonella sp.]|nr:tripartite tricarboxylate transporter substrate binding protein [Ideonella sp.]
MAIRKIGLSRRALALVLGTVALQTFSLGALAQSWPAKPLTMVVPWPPGGPTDIGARPLAKAMQEVLGQTVVIENKAGAGGNLGTGSVVQAAADGYTLLVTSSAPIVINPSLYKKMAFDPAKDLIPVTNVLRMPLVLVVPASSNINDLAGLMAQVRANRTAWSLPTLAMAPRSI